MWAALGAAQRKPRPLATLGASCAVGRAERQFELPLRPPPLAERRFCPFLPPSDCLGGRPLNRISPTGRVGGRVEGCL